ncbi:AraC family transcriptional regulator [Streptomyces malaysiensis]|uniref:AraC family transcriptional regulator n=1 Tax=Streptomyces malaysiensis TaxID=92644 RepID=UPI0032207139|nr:AraC family transcriptional regulator [Streptomyces malaysiensis]
MGRGRRTVTVHHVRAALRGAQRLGLDTVPLLQRARIPPLLLADDRARVSPEQFARLVRALHRVTRDEFLGLGTIRSRPGTFAMMCYASLGCPDLGAAVERGARFYRLFPGGPNLALERGASPGREAVFALRGGLGPHEGGLTAAEGHIVAEWLMLIWHRLAGWLIGRRIPLLWAQFAYPPPPYAEDYEPLFGCPPRFGAPRTAAGFDRRWLTAPVVQDEATLQTLLRYAPAGLLSRGEYGTTTVAEQVRHALTGALRTRGGPADGPRARRTARLPELPEVAARLAVSPATLRRRLSAEGTSFQRLKDAVRRDEAVSSLAEGAEPIADLAVRLGFSEDTAFHRAFRRWTGTTPGAYRHETWSQQI